MNVTYEQMWRHLNDRGEGFSAWETWEDVEDYADDPNMEIIERRHSDSGVMVIREYVGEFCGQSAYRYIIVGDAHGPWAVEVNMRERLREIDPRGVLSTCEDVMDMVGDSLLTRDMINAINDVIDEWCEADPDGYDDAAAERMATDIEYIIEETI